MLSPGSWPPNATVIIETVSTVDGVAALRDDYERLLLATANTLPFALHEWHFTWCCHFLNCNLRVRDELLFYVLRNSANVCVAIVPFIVSRRRVGPLEIVSVSVLGADPAITEIRAPLIEPGYEHLTARAVQDHLAKAGGWDWIQWTGINDAFAEALAVNDRLHWQLPVSAYVLDLAPTWDEFRHRLKRNIRESLRHCYNSLKRDGHVFALRVITDPGEMRQGVNRFLALHVMRANLKTTVIHPNRFESQVSRDFLYAVCERLAARGAVRLFQLEIGSKIVAMRIGFVVGDSLYMYYSGFDPEWARYSVMTTTLAEAIKYAIAHGLQTVNLSPTEDTSKTRWSPRQVDYKAAYERGGRLRSGMAHHAYLKARSGAGLQSWILQNLIPSRRDWH